MASPRRAGKRYMADWEDNGLIDCPYDSYDRAYVGGYDDGYDDGEEATQKAAQVELEKAKKKAYDKGYQAAMSKVWGAAGRLGRKGGLKQ